MSYIDDTHTQLFNGPLSGTAWVGRYQKKHSPTHTHPDHRTSFINFLHLLWSIASSLFNVRSWHSFSTTSTQSSLVFLLVWGPLLHTPCISSPNYHHLFAADAQVMLYRWTVTWTVDEFLLQVWPSRVQWERGAADIARLKAGSVSGRRLWLPVDTGRLSAAWARQGRL